MTALIIGLDVGAQLHNCGYCIARVIADRVEICEADLLAKGSKSSKSLADLANLAKSSTNTLLAIDAPMGWPAAMGQALLEHQAGNLIRTPRMQLFRRSTDSFVKQHTGKTPLDVGAEKIAHAAHHALEILDGLRRLSDLPIPLAWSPSERGVRAIEVYPAATLAGRLIKAPGYKKDDTSGEVARSELARMFSSVMPDLAKYVRAPIDVFDACLCALAGKDFLDGHSLVPENLDLARKEGWIWVCSRLPSAR